MIHLGISTCPNDTFAFHGLMHGKVDWQGLDFRIDLQDVQELNDRLMAGEFDVAKASFHAALMLAEETVVLPSGSALGFGNGPLLLSRHADCEPADVFDEGRLPIVLCPGPTTTATLLYRLCYDTPCDLRQVVFSEIMPALQQQQADFGVCIHEGRFTWQQQGLHCVSDLGQWWQERTDQPLPLGGILARRRLGTAKLARIQQVIRDSIRYGLAHREQTLPTMRRYAAELADDVLLAHVDLYVNQHTLDLGASGRQALATLSRLASGIDKGPAGSCLRPLEVFDETADPRKKKNHERLP
jgi:1,4-dihydroxy-6-naphthoate synthase